MIAPFAFEGHASPFLGSAVGLLLVGAALAVLFASEHHSGQAADDTGRPTVVPVGGVLQHCLVSRGKRRTRAGTARPVPTWLPGWCGQTWPDLISEIAGYWVRSTVSTQSETPR